MDEGEDCLGKDCTFAIEARPRPRYVAVIQQVSLDDCLEGGLSVALLASRLHLRESLLQQPDGHLAVGLEFAGAA